MMGVRSARTAVFALLLGATTASAQIVVDGTFGSPGALLPDASGEIEIPESVGRRAGANLFHSFDSFSIRQDETADFTSAGPGVDRILARVTGGETSLIDGILRSSIAGADLYLFNPQGVVFGPEGRLDLAGSFFASTADALEFEDGSEYSADASRAVVLTSEPPSAWGFEAAAPAAIEVDRGALAVGAGRRLSLVAGQVDVRGRSELDAATWTSLGSDAGSIELAATGGPATVLLDLADVDADGTLAAGGTVSLRENATVETSGNGGGRFVARASVIEFDGSYVLAENTGSAPPPEWALDLQAGEQIVLSGGSVLRSTVGGAGAGGDLRARSGDLVEIREGAHLYSLTSTGDGRGGDVEVEAPRITLESRGKISTQTRGVGAGGALTVETDSLVVRDSGSLVAAVTQPGSTDPSRFGPGGALRVMAGDITLEDGGQILSRTTGSGHGGALHVTADHIRIDGVGPDATLSGILSNEEPGNIAPGDRYGNAGDLTVEASHLEIFDGGEVQLRSFIRNQPRMDGLPLPHLRVEVDEIELSGTVENADSGIYTQGFDRDAGSAEIISNRLWIRPGALVSTSTSGAGRGGDLRIQSEEILVEAAGTNVQRSGIFSSTLSTDSDAGDGGNLSIFTRDLAVRSRADVSVATRGDGNAGSLSINAATDDPLYRADWARNAQIRVDDARILSRVEFDFPQMRSGGDIDIQAGSLSLENGGAILALNQGVGDAGNISIRLTESFESHRGSVSSAAVQGLGGDVRIEAGRSISLVESSITTSVTETFGDGGNVDLRSEVVVLNGSTVEAKAVQDHGGNIRIESGYFVISADSVLDATSAAGPELDGEVVIRTLEESLPQHLAQLPDRFLEDEDALRRTCAARSARGGSLTIDTAVLRVGPDGPIDSGRDTNRESHGCPPIR